MIGTTEERRPAGRVAVLLGIASLLLAPASRTGAQEETVSMEVEFEIEAACRLAAESLDFGQTQRPAGSAVVVTGESTITVTCPDQTPYEIGLSLGDNASGQLRLLFNGNRYAAGYFLFQDALKSQQWGDGDNGLPRKSAVGTGSAQQHTVYGNVVVSSGAPVGDATDTVLVSIFL